MSNNKTATVIARIEPDTKIAAESILEQMGIPASVAINMFYKKIIQSNGIPFSVNLKSNNSVPYDSDETAISEMLSNGFAQAKRGEGKPTKLVTDSIREEMRGRQ